MVETKLHQFLPFDYESHKMAKIIFGRQRKFFLKLTPKQAEDAKELLVDKKIISFQFLSEMSRYSNSAYSGSEGNIKLFRSAVASSDRAVFNQ